VFFGATVTDANGRGTEMTITIGGIDEAELDRGQVSWLSPIARALMKARQGDIVAILRPEGRWLVCYSATKEIGKGRKRQCADAIC
jgi:transcription elongation factor GreB